MSKKSVAFFRVATSFFLILSFFITPVSYTFAQEAKIDQTTSSEQVPPKVDDLSPSPESDTPAVDTTPDTTGTIDVSKNKDDGIVPTDTLSEEDQKIYDAEVAAMKAKKEKPSDEEAMANRSGTVSSSSLILNSNSQHETIRPEIDQTTGALVYNYPIETPDGVNGTNPALKLRYNSQDTKTDSVFGYGWSSNIPYIERVNKHGTDQLYTGTYDDYISSTLGELVKDTSTHYVPKSASDIINLSFSSNVWSYTDKNGTTYSFGSTAASRQDDPGNSSHISKWMLDSITDSNGNVITYYYAKNQGQIYPQRISYGIYEINFKFKERADTTESYARGFFVKTGFVFDGIEINKVNSPTAPSLPTVNVLVVGGGAGGTMAGKSLDEVINGLKNGTIKTSSLPVEYSEINGIRVVDNNRSAYVLKQAGIPENNWNWKVAGPETAQKIINKTSQDKLPGTGSSKVKVRGQ